MEQINEKKIQKCLKSYLTGKKYYTSDTDKAFEYFKQCIKILNDLKEQNIKIVDGLEEIINETETECSKYLTQTISYTIDKPYIKKIKSMDSDNELFEFIETGDIDKLKKFTYGNINFNIYNDSGLSPLHYAIKFGDTSFIKQSLKLGACIDQTNKFGHTLLEFACLEKDPNMIMFLSSYGADMKKHLEFREGKKYFNNSNQIDITLLEKKIMDINNINNHKIIHLNFLFDYINPTDSIDIDYCDPKNSTILSDKITFSDFVKKLDWFVNNLDYESQMTFLTILREEITNDISLKLGCPTKPIEIILYNLVPFINYNFNLRFNWLISLEIKFIILKVLKNKVKINTKELKQELTELLYLSYIKPEILPDGIIQTLVLQWIYKIKV